MTTQYVIASAEGKILRVVRSVQPQLPLPGEQVVEHVEAVDVEAHYVDAGVVVPFPTRPSAIHTWDWTTKSWQAPALDAVKQRKMRELREARDKAELSIFTFSAVTFDCDERARLRIAEVCSRAMREVLPTFERRWPTSSGGSVLLSRVQLIALADALEDHTDSVRTTFRNLRQAVNDATTVAEVESVVWPVN